MGAFSEAVSAWLSGGKKRKTTAESLSRQKRTCPEAPAIHVSNGLKSQLSEIICIGKFSIRDFQFSIPNAPARRHWESVPFQAPFIGNAGVLLPLKTGIYRELKIENREFLGNGFPV